ncbi:copper resistance protein B [uncultured Alcanivorax sp.]|uniref:copper resistance protein B n=1 Tax=uncultured Alcanivorax sp. TaxID=191215 RepID=UPI00345D3131
MESGLRLRYEIRRELAPYIGVHWEKQYGDTADSTRAAGGDPEEASLVAGVYFWF